MFCVECFFFFFFQAEDGIRDVAVTGVQTCALPIYSAGLEKRHRFSGPALSRTGARGGDGSSDRARTARGLRGLWRPHERTEDDSALGKNRSEEHTSELQSRLHLVCRLLLEKKKKKT